MSDEQAHLKLQFDKAQQRLFEAVNRESDQSIPGNVLTVLRRDVLHAQARCREAGLDVESLYEFAERKRVENEAAIRAYADSEKQIIPSLPRKTRIRIAILLGLLVAGGTTFILHPAVSMIVGFIAYGIADGWLAQVFPTPGVRVGRRAAALGVDYLSFWPPKSDDHKDYRYACNYERRRGRAPVMVKVR